MCRCVNKMAEDSIRALDQSDLFRLRDWFQNYLADKWDQEIISDIQAGRLDSLAQEALEEHAAGETKPL